jgi:hypothetical protein
MEAGEAAFAASSGNIAKPAVAPIKPAPRAHLANRRHEFLRPLRIRDHKLVR